MNWSKMTILDNFFILIRDKWLYCLYLEKDVDNVDDDNDDLHFMSAWIEKEEVFGCLFIFLNKITFAGRYLQNIFPSKK